MTAAPLKVLNLDRLGLRGGEFPRLNDRGPIEGPDGKKIFCPEVEFPRLNDRGPIEGYRRRKRRGGWDIQFPRLNDRGPIEGLRWERDAEGKLFVSAVE